MPKEMNDPTPRKDKLPVITNILEDLEFTADCLDDHASKMEHQGRWHYVRNCASNIRLYVEQLKEELNVE